MKIRHWPAAGAALALLVPIVGCRAAPVSPLPVAAPVTATAVASPTAGPSPSATTRPPNRRPPSPATSPSRPSSTASPACEGAIRYVLRADTDLELVPSLCFAAGAILRIEGTGPDTVRATPPDNVAETYEAGIVELRFVQTGPVTVDIDRGGRTYHITVVVVR